MVNIAAGSFACRRGVPTQVFFLFLKYFFFFGYTWSFVAVCGLSLVASRDYFLLVVHGFLIAVASHCTTQSLNTWVSVLVVQGLSFSEA